MRVSVLLFLFLGTLPAQAQWAALDSARAHQRAGVEAYGAGDDAAFLRHMEAASTLRPHHPTLAYYTAKAHARAGDAEAALAALERYAAFGLPAEVETDDDFTTLGQHPAFAAMAAQLTGFAAPIGRADTVWTGLDGGFFPEGIARDPRSGDLYLSSIALARVVRIRDGGAEVFFDGAAEGAWSMTGLAVDASHDRLWACTANIPPGLSGDTTGLGRSALLSVDLRDGRSGGRYGLPGDGPRLCGDLHLSDDGTVWLTDSAGGGVYRLRPGAARLEAVLPPGSLPSPQGLTLAPNGRLYVADYALGIVWVDAEGGTAHAVPYPPGTTLLGIDGLYYHDGSLIGIQNGVRPHRVLRIPIEGEGLGVPQVLARALPAFGEPTLGVLDGGALLFVANAAWPHLGRDGAVDAGAAQPPVLLRLLLRP